MNTAIKAIETHYNGYRFRSRIEARWAVLFDALGVKYEYEKEGFDLGDLGYYLPDFWLPNSKCWIEIKSAFPTANESDKMLELVAGTSSSGMIMYGSNFDFTESFSFVYSMINDVFIEIAEKVIDLRKNGVARLLVSEVNKSYITVAMNESLLQLENYVFLPDGISQLSHRNTRLQYAQTAARKARFEHGERG